MKTITSFMLKNIFMDTINGVSLVFSMSKQESQINDIAKDTLEEFQTEYMKKGWTIISSISKASILTVIIFALMFLNKDNPFYYRVVFLWPLMFVSHVVVDKMFASNKFAHEFSFVILIVQTGLMNISGTIQRKSYCLYEMWIPFIIYCFYGGVFCFMSWRKYTVILFVFVLAYLIVINILYDESSFLLYVALLFAVVLYPAFCMFISLKMKEMIVVLKHNKDLIHTIQTVLQVFPEGVVIRSLDETSRQTITKFANNIAAKVLIAEQQVGGQDLGIDIKVIEDESAKTDRKNSPTIKLDEFLNQQELKIEFEHSECIEQMIKIKQSIDMLYGNFICDDENEELNFETIFNVKSIKVNWNNNSDSYMHVFINTTQVKKLEQERANRQYQHMMFASLSHELRTPINAFSNSLYLIRFTFDEIIAHIDKLTEIKCKVEPLNQKLFKFVKIGEVSSCLLINLVDDILDMSKFDAKTFQLNINEFNLSNILKDIDYIFGFQCIEKNIRFSINCHPSIADNLYWSDYKRIKQVLINLISNSLKFTERGRIKVSVREIEKNGEDYLKFEVYDTGVGISKQDIPKLFKMFGMLSQHRNKLNQSGSGIGLSISKKIVESLDGKIKVSSRENEWTRFVFTIRNMHEAKIKIEESKENQRFEESKNFEIEWPQNNQNNDENSINDLVSLSCEN